MIVNVEDLITPIEFADFWGFQKTTVYKWIERGRLVPLRIGGKCFFLKSSPLPDFVKKDKRRKSL